jgi:hypothetical protein
METTETQIAELRARIEAKVREIARQAEGLKRLLLPIPLPPLYVLPLYVDD